MEGEFDKLALAEVGITNVVSLPNGAMHGDGSAKRGEANKMARVNEEYLQVGPGEKRRYRGNRSNVDAHLCRHTFASISLDT